MGSATGSLSWIQVMIFLVVPSFYEYWRIDQVDTDVEYPDIIPGS